MSARLEILKAGPGVTIQDGGRHGWLRWGVTAAGPMDRAALATANLALGNPADQAGLEISLGGVELTVSGGPLALAVVAPGFLVTIDGRPLPAMVVLSLEPGMRLAVRAGAGGAWGYLALGAVIDVPMVLGSRATHSRSGFGGLDGRGLRVGDHLALSGPLTAAEIAPAALIAPWLDEDRRPIRAVAGPQDDYFSPDQLAAFTDRDWTVGPRSDRMAYALEGPPLTHAKGHDIVSDGVTLGSVQVPGSGLPFVLMADRQPTGGYPKIATVISADLGRLAQLRPGERLRFTLVTIAEAVAARRALAEALKPPIGRQPLRRSEFPSPFLLSQNLVSGVVDAQGWLAGHDDLW